MLEIHIVASGQVQGVGFRATACVFARELGLSGQVKNLPDGTVELIAQGKKLDLEKLVTRLKKAFHLEHVQINYREPQTSYQDFSIA